MGPRPPPTAAVSNIVAAHYLSQAYRVGQRIQVGDHEGRIVEIAPTLVEE